VIDHAEEHYYGGSYWRMPPPKYQKWMISTYFRKFVLVRDPNERGSLLKHNRKESGDTLIWTLDELKELFKDATYLGEFYKLKV